MNKYGLFLITAIMLTVGSCTDSPEVSKADFYVSANGSDSNPGTLKQPFATFEHARGTVREIIKKGLRKNIRILIQGGTYQLEKPLIFAYEDSGSSQYSVTYTAYPNEKVIISGGRIITGWEKGSDNIWTAQIPEVQSGKWWFRQLFANGKRLPRSRFPDEGFLKIKAVSENVRKIEFQQPLPEADFDSGDIELVVIENWSITRGLIVSAEGNSVETKTAMGWIGHGVYHTTASPGKSAYLEHAKAVFDKPGCWYLERKTGTLYYKAHQNENPNIMSFVVPKLEQLLVIRGEPDKPVCNVHFRSLNFEHTEWPLPEIGYNGIQAGYYGSSFKPLKPVYSQPAAIEYSYTDNCTIELCEIAHTGASGIGLGAGCRRNKITGCKVFDIGGNGINIGHRVRPQIGGTHGMDEDWQNQREIPVDNEVANNYVHHCGQVSFGAVGIFTAFTDGTRIAHNLVKNTPYTGISAGFAWNTNPTSQKNCIIEYNHVYDVMLKLADGGCIYTLGLQPGTIIRGNLLHDVHRSSFAHGGAPNNGFFFDQGSKGYLVEGNVIYNTHGEPIRLNQCKPHWHTWKNHYEDITPDDPDFPDDIAKKAGLEPAWQYLAK